MSSPFQSRLTFEQRRVEHDRITRVYPRHVPIVAEAGTRETPHANKSKFLVPEGLTVGQLSFVLRKRIRELRPSESLYLMVNGTLVNSTSTLRELHSSSAQTDGFLYISYVTENTFG